MTAAPRSAPWARGMVDAALAEAEQEWRVPRRVGLVLLVGPPVGAVAVAATLVHRPLFRWLTREDGILEWCQFLTDVVALGAGLWVASLLWRRRERGGALLWSGFALALLFIAGEEISWGQRVFDLGTPEVLAERNHQGESNVHNIRPVQDTINVGFMLVGLYGSIVAATLRRRVDPARRAWWFDLVVPPMVLGSAFLLVFAYKLLRLVALQDPRFTIVKYGEYIELCTAGALAAFAVLTLRRLHGAPSATAADRGAVDLRDAPAPVAPQPDRAPAPQRDPQRTRR